MAHTSAAAGAQREVGEGGRGGGQMDSNHLKMHCVHCAKTAREMHQEIVRNFRLLFTSPPALLSFFPDFVQFLFSSLFILTLAQRILLHRPVLAISHLTAKVINEQSGNSLSRIKYEFSSGP